MGLLTAVFTYFVTWWIVLFLTLPWGNRQPDSAEKGMAHGAPINPNMKKKFVATTILSFVVLGVIEFAVQYKIIDFREAAREMEIRLYGVRTSN